MITWCAMAKLVVVVTWLVGVSVAQAQPTCLHAMKPSSSHVVGGAPVTCLGSDCIDVATGKAVKAPDLRPPVRQAGGKVTACAGGTCDPVKASLAESVTRWLAAHQRAKGKLQEAGTVAEVTSDRKYVHLRDPMGRGNPSALWSVERDAVIDLGKDVEADVIGGRLTAHDSSKRWFIDGAGKRIGEPFALGMTAALAKDRVAVVQGETLLVIDGKGKVTATLALPKPLGLVFAVGELRDDELIVVTGDQKQLWIGVVKVGAELTVVGTVHAIKRCDPV